MEKKKAKGAGGKLSRSEIVQARLSPKLRFVAEILSRQQRRTISSLIENIIIKEANSSEVEIDDNDFRYYKKTNLMEVLNYLWGHHEPKRIVIMGLYYPSLLSSHEEKIYRRIRNNKYFWRCYRILTTDINNRIIEDGWRGIMNHDGLIEEHVEEYWDVLNSEEMNLASLPPPEEPGDILIDRQGEYKVYDTQLPIDTTNLNPEECIIAIEKYFNKIEEEAFGERYKCP